MKAAVITLQNIKNYGSMLQAYATQELLKREGIESVMIDYTRPDALFWNHIFGYSKHNNLLVGLVKSLILLPTEIKYKFLWDSFKKKHIQSTKEKYTTLEELTANPPVADIYCSGSDQVWNSGWNGGLLKEFFLDFAPKGKKRYALASSIGMSKFDESEMPELTRLLNEYDAISVRETSGLNLVKSLGVSNAINVIDPTLTVDSKFWGQLATAPKRKKTYILIYQLGKDANIDKYARYMADKTGLEVVRICIRYDYALRFGKSVLIPSFEEFLTLFANAEYVITDSFHATCFSLNFNKRFWCILPDMYQGRILDLLKMVSLTERVVGSDFSKVEIEASIDYDRVNEIINTEREKVAAFYRSIWDIRTVCERDKCTGCMACVDVCPQRNAIKIVDSMRTFNAVKTDNCIDCGACQKKCQQNNPPSTLCPIHMYQGWSKSDYTRMNAASGGFASAISEAFVKNEGVVCSCTFDNGTFSFTIVDNSKDIGKFAGSKYVKSNASGVYRKVRELLKAGRKCLFVALPCQVAAMKNFIPEPLQKNLYTIDLICHGTPSAQILEKFLEQYGTSFAELDAMSFRSKVSTEDMIRLAPEGSCDYYSLAFSHCQIFTSNCYECRYASIERVSDLTLGDSWGAELPAIESKKGISLVLCQTAKGKELLENAAIEMKDVDVERAIAHNDQLRHPSVKPDSWERFFDQLESQTKFNKVVFNVLSKACIRQYIKLLAVRLGIKKTDGINYGICIKKKVITI